MLKPDREGFVTEYLVQGPQVQPYTPPGENAGNQLLLETELRKQIPGHEPLPDVPLPRAGETGRLNMPWRAAAGCPFVNLSDFYPTMQHVRFDMALVLEAKEDMCIRACLWSYAAVDVYVNGKREGGIPGAVYKPISREEMLLPLKAGRNLVYLACETLGVRDTRSVAGLQILERREDVQTDLPDERQGEITGRAMAFLEGIRLTETELVLPSAAGDLQMTYKHGDPDLAVSRLPAVWHDISGITRVPLKDGEAKVTVKLSTEAGDFVRVFERTEQILPQRILPVPGIEENMQLIFRRIAAVETLSRGEKFGFPVSNMLARKYLKDTSKDDARLMQEMLELIDSRVDCSDFLVCGLIRYVKNYAVSPDVAKQIRHVLLRFRYWLDMEGTDGMCFWSENHCLMFYASAMQAGEMYPDDYFEKARMTGRQLQAWGRERVLEWLTDVETYGFEEFLSTVYMCVTFAALLNVVDYSEKAISDRARVLTDRLLEMLSLHVFRGGIVAPMGRVYREVLYPFRQGAMALLNMINPALPYDYGEGWLGFFATSTYRVPEGLVQRMEDEVSTRYLTGNAEIVLEKHRDWCLTSAACPGPDRRRWEREAGNGHAAVKSFNERFHGTTYFRPGIYGYQQHLWYAALDGAAVIFMNHPGSFSEGGDMRPGYWHGNGVLPALKQDGNRLGMIYRIPGEHPIHWIHLYAPVCRFDEVSRHGPWLVFRKDQGYMALWTSSPMEDYHGMNEGCERRIYGDNIAALVVMGGREYRDTDDFISALPTPAFSGDTLLADSFRLTYRAGQDDTQYL